MLLVIKHNVINFPVKIISLGFLHEQMRSDRDQYIYIHKQNVKPKYLTEFEKADPKRYSNLGMSYDYCSVMHYHSDAFSKVGWHIRRL